ncbi:MAG: sensor histidine kinase [Prolixibacteraceae bacterium]
MINHKVLFHFGMWILVLLILTGLTSLNGSWPFSFYLLNMLVALPAMILFSYSVGALGNKLLFENNSPILFLTVFFIFTFFLALTIPLLQHYIFFGVFYPRVFEPTVWFNWRLIPQNLILLWFPYFILSIQSFFMHWFKAEQEKLIIENKQLLSEIQLMKIKLHPHFLFNTLNNLYAMSRKDNKNTSEYIMKLSELYRIMLYECNKDFYPVFEEVALIRNYIELEKIRYDERLKLIVHLPENIDESLIIPPLLLFTFVENSFKHGCREDVGLPFIHFELLIKENEISFYSENSIPDGQFSKVNYGGIGLSNTRKRLDLIYQNEYSFQIETVNDLYVVALKIPKLYLS